MDNSDTTTTPYTPGNAVSHRHRPVQVEEGVDALVELQRTARIGGWDYDVERKAAHWTEGMHFLFDTPGDFRPGLESVCDYVATDRVDDLRLMLNDLLQTGQPFSTMLPAISHDGRSFWIWVCGRAVITADGRPSRLVGSVQDVTRLHGVHKDVLSDQDRLQHTLETAYDAHWDYDLLMGAVHFSPRCAEMLGYPEGYFGSDFTVWNDNIHPEDLERALIQLREHLDWGLPYRVEYRVRARDGEYRRLLAAGQVIAHHPTSNVPLRMVGVVTDITELQQVRQQMAAAESRFQTIYENAGLGIAILSLPDCGIERANPAFLSMFGLPSPEAPSLLRSPTLFELLPPDERQDSRQAVERLVGADAATRYVTEKRMEGPDGRKLWVNLTCTAIRGPDGTAESVIALADDVTERRELQEKLEYDASHDRLTGVANRARLLENLTQAFGLAQRYHRPMVLAICDIDYFKRVNDTHLHVTGDAVLARFARILQESVRSTDTVGRYGGEEFGLVFPDTDLAGAHICLERAFERLREERFKSLKTGEDFGITATCGVAPFEAGLTVEDLIAATDKALYAGKMAGRDRIVVYAELTPDQRLTDSAERAKSGRHKHCESE